MTMNFAYHLSPPLFAMPYTDVHNVGMNKIYFFIIIYAMNWYLCLGWGESSLNLGSTRANTIHSSRQERMVNHRENGIKM